MKNRILGIMAILGITACGSGGGSSGSDSVTPSPTPTPVIIPNCVGFPISVTSFVSGYKGMVEVTKDGTTATYPSFVDISSYDPAYYWSYNRYVFRASQMFLDVPQNLIEIQGGNLKNTFTNGVLVTSFGSSNPNVNIGESVTISINYTIASNVTFPAIPGNYTAQFTCIRNGL